MTIGYLTMSVSRQAGGLFDAVRRLAAETAALDGASISVFGLADDSTAADRPAWNGIPVTTVPVRGPRALGYAPALTAALQAANPDLLHQHGIWMYPSAACNRWFAQSRKPYIVSPHGMLDPWALRNSAWKKRLAGWLFQGQHLNRAACLHALCQAEAEAMRAYGLRNPIAVIPNGVDLPDSRPAPTPAWRKQLPENARILLYLGRLHPKKGLVELLHAWSAAKQGALSAGWRLVIAGWSQGGHEEHLRELACQLSVDDTVSFIGPQFGEDKDATFRAAEAFILPSHSEGLPVVVLEAWSCGLPVLQTPQCNIPEGFEHDAALRIEPQGDAIASGVNALFAMTDADRQAMGNRGLELVKERFTWPRIAADMLCVYQWVLGGPKPAGIPIIE